MRVLKTAFEKMKFRERVLSLVTLLVVAGLVFHTLVLSELAAVSKSRNALKEVQTDLERIRSNLTSLQALKAEDVRSDPLWRYKTENSGVAGLVRAVSSIEAAKPDFSIRKISSEKVEQASGFEKTTLQMEIETPFNTLGSFLEQLEKSDLLTRIESVQIARVGREIRLCHARIRLNSYNWREL
jgi:hypothetical protein